MLDRNAVIDVLQITFVYLGQQWRRHQAITWTNVPEPMVTYHQSGAVEFIGGMQKLEIFAEQFGSLYKEKVHAYACESNIYHTNPTEIYDRR